MFTEVVLPQSVSTELLFLCTFDCICQDVHLLLCYSEPLHHTPVQDEDKCFHTCNAGNDHSIGVQNLNPLSHPNATLAQAQDRQARASGENLNYMTL